MDVLRSGGIRLHPGRHGQGAIHAEGTFLRSFRWIHVRATRPGEPRVAWPGPGRPGQDPIDVTLTIDLDSTICESYGLAKERARHHGWTGGSGAIRD